MNPDRFTNPDRHDDEQPPIMGTWPNLYRFVLIYIACVIGLFYWFTRAYAP
jgi:hypothetical protein